MTDEEKKQLRRLREAASEFISANDKLTEKLAANRAEAQEARRELIKAWNATPDVKEVRHSITARKHYFSDMTGGKNYDYKDVLVLVSDDDAEENINTGSYMPAGRLIHIHKKFICDPATVMHELLHFHIAEMTAEARRDLYAKLLKKLSRKIPNFDIILGLKDSVLISRCLREGTTPPDPDSHNNLFFVKSIDLDLRTMQEPGTVFGYGMKEAINEIQEALNPLIGVRLEAQYLPLDQ